MATFEKLVKNRVLSDLYFRIKLNLWFHIFPQTLQPGGNGSAEVNSGGLSSRSGFFFLILLYDVIPDTVALAGSLLLFSLPLKSVYLLNPHPSCKI